MGVRDLERFHDVLQAAILPPSREREAQEVLADLRYLVAVARDRCPPRELRA